MAPSASRPRRASGVDTPMAGMASRTGGDAARGTATRPVPMPPAGAARDPPASPKANGSRGSPAPPSSATAMSTAGRSKAASRNRTLALPGATGALVPGDLIFVADDPGDPSTIHHVGR
jgi:hypothetical protein